MVKLWAEETKVAEGNGVRLRLWMAACKVLHTEVKLIAEEARWWLAARGRDEGGKVSRSWVRGKR